MSDTGAPEASPASEIFTDPTPLQEPYPDLDPLPDPRDDDDLFPYQLECDTRALAGALSTDVRPFLPSDAPSDGGSPFAEHQHQRVTFDIPPGIGGMDDLGGEHTIMSPHDPLDPSLASPQNQLVLEMAMQRSLEHQGAPLQTVGSLKRAYSAGDVQEVLQQQQAAAEEGSVAPSSLSHNVVKSHHRNRARFPKARSMFDVKNFALHAWLPSWLKIDATGECSLVKIDKSRISARLGVQWRDLRIVDPNLATQYPSAILVRDKAIVVNLEYIKAVITSSYILVHNLNSDGVLSVVAKEPYLPFVEELKRKLAAPPLEGMLEPQRVLTGDDVSKSAPTTPTNRGGSPTMLNPNGSVPLSTLARMEAHGGGSPIDLAKVSPQLSDIVLPFELRCLEVCLEHINGYWQEKVNKLDVETRVKLDKLTGKVNTEHLEAVRTSKGLLNRYVTKVETIREVLEKLLDDDKDMLAMNLTAKEQLEAQLLQGRPSAGAPRSPAPLRLTLPSLPSLPTPRRTHTHSSSSSSNSSTDSEEEEQIADVEMLLEAYFMQIDNTYNKLQALKEYIDDTEDLVNTELDYNLNQLIEVDLLLTAGTFAITLVAVMGAIFGMNLGLANKRTEKYSNWVQVTSVAWVAAAIFFVAFFLVCKFKQIIVNI